MMIPKRRLLTLMFACLCFKKSFLINILNELRQKLEPAIILKLLTCQRITSKNTPTPEPAIRSGDTGQQIPCFYSC